MTIRDIIKEQNNQGIVNVYTVDAGEDDFFWDCYTWWAGEWCTEGYENVLNKHVYQMYPGVTGALIIEVLR